MLVLSYILLALCIFLAGGSVFSFVNLAADRLPEKKSAVKGRSHCDNCGRTLGLIDMIPVFSYIFLRGRCRKCGSHLSVKYLITETAGGLIALYMAYAYRGNWPELLLGFIFIAILACVFLIDMKTMTIPDQLIAAMAVLSIISAFILRDVKLIPRITGFFSVSIPMLILAFLIEGAFGGGDIKLVAVTGFFLGWKLNIFAFFVAVMTGGIYAIFLLIRRKKGDDRHFAFGPFLAIGSTVAFLWGNEIIEWYLGLFI